MLRAESEPEALRAIFERDRAIHAYGLADLDEPFWSQSRWYRRGDAAVGVLELAGATVAIVYCVSANAPHQTLGLLADLGAAGLLPEHSFLTGPLGVADAMRPTHDVRWCSPHARLAIASPFPAVSGRARVGQADATRLLDMSDLHLIDELFAAVPDHGRFFTPSMLDSGAYVGRVDRAGTLLAMAGVHVVSERFRVAAIGNVLTHTGHRREGHARDLIGAVCARLAGRVDVIALNVSDDNIGARALYDSLGFVSVLAFDEGEFVLRQR